MKVSLERGVTRDWDGHRLLEGLLKCGRFKIDDRVKVLENDLAHDCPCAKIITVTGGVLYHESDPRHHRSGDNMRRNVKIVKLENIVEDYCLDRSRAENFVSKDQESITAVDLVNGVLKHLSTSSKNVGLWIHLDVVTLGLIGATVTSPAQTSFLSP